MQRPVGPSLTPILWTGLGETLGMARWGPLTLLSLAWHKSVGAFLLPGCSCRGLPAVPRAAFLDEGPAPASQESQVGQGKPQGPSVTLGNPPTGLSSALVQGM